MGFFGLFNKKKKAKLLELQFLVVRDSPDRLIMSESQLMTIAIQQAENDIRILRDCMHILETTLKPDVFFARLKLMEETAEHLVRFEPYVPFSGASPYAAYEEFSANKHICVNMFITRYFSCVCEKADSMKTERGRNNQYLKFIDSFAAYPFYINDENKNYIDSLYNQAITKRLKP